MLYEEALSRSENTNTNTALLRCLRHTKALKGKLRQLGALKTRLFSLSIPKPIAFLSTDYGGPSQHRPTATRLPKKSQQTTSPSHLQHTSSDALQTSRREQE